MEQVIIINRQLSIPAEELGWRFSRAGGPGGQNVNRTSTRVELLFDVNNSPSLSAEQRDILLRELASWVDAGVLRVTVQSERSQWRNRLTAITRFASLLRAALTERTPRIRSHIPRSSQERRLRAKRHAKTLRNLRQVPSDD